MSLRRPFPLLMWLLLAISLLLNAVAVGIFLRLNSFRSTLNGDSGGLRAMNDDLTTAVVMSIRSHKEDFDTSLNRLGKARREMFDAAAARPYDQARVEAAMEEVRAATTALQLQGQMVLLEEFNRNAQEQN